MQSICKCYRDGDGQTRSLKPPTLVPHSRLTQWYTQDEGNGAVAYRMAAENVWALEVPLEAATNQAELNDYQVEVCWRAMNVL